MNTLADFIAAQAAHNAQIGTYIDDITGDIAALNAQIDAFQNSPGNLSAADQASLDQIQANTASVSDRLAALGALTPPVVPKA